MDSWMTLDMSNYVNILNNWFWIRLSTFDKICDVSSEWGLQNYDKSSKS